MKQQMFINIITEFDLEKHDQTGLEATLEKAIKEMLKDKARIPMTKTDVEFEYGDSV